MKKKLFLVSIVMIMICLVGTGCVSNQPSPSNSVNVGISITDKITQKIGLPAFTHELEEEYSKVEIDAYVLDLMNTVNLVALSFRASLQEEYNNNENPDPRFVIGGDKVYFTASVFDNSKDEVFFEINFASIDAWDYYHPSDENEEDETIHFGNVFIEGEKTSSTFAFSVVGSDGNITGQVYEEILMNTLNSHFPLFQPSQLNFEYTYGTTYPRIHSNCDNFSIVNGVHTHSWIVEKSNLQNAKSIELWTKKANPGWWYLTIIGVTVFGMGVCIGGCFLFKKRKKGQL